jgi:hypothetical protein
LVTDTAELRFSGIASEKSEATDWGSCLNWREEQLSIAAGDCHVPWEIQLVAAGIERSTQTLNNRTTAGPISQTLNADGDFAGLPGIRWQVTAEYWHTLGLTEIALTIHNNRAAKHRHGLWDLGDSNSLFFKQLTLKAPSKPALSSALHDGEQIHDGERLAIYQDSSGGENWQSRVHVDRHGHVPCRFRGYQIHDGEQLITDGLRAMPSLRTAVNEIPVEITYPEFWQNFPSGIRCDRGVSVDFFPAAWNGPHELQPGEQKTQTVWIACGDSLPKWGTRTANRPPQVRPTAQWFAASKAIPLFSTRETPNAKLREWMRTSLDGAHSFAANRELIDEYGWRNYGDVYADHENQHSGGDELVISHYNNQYDLVFGFLLSWLQSDDSRWWHLADELARHVMDIDLYHTDEDRAAYSGGLFWHTDHYKTAHTATHRTYAAANVGDQLYGGGPACEHNYTTGLLTYYYLTGRKSVRDAVLSLADWVIAMDDGKKSALAFLTDAPTGLATQCYTPDYHGPSRGSGNSVNALLDGWILTEDRKYLHYAETIIRRAVHPHEEINPLELLNVEMRWSYTVFLVTLGRYLELKTLHDIHDSMYQYAVACLVHFGHWMLANERTNFDDPAQLEFPTETWPAQDLRKANVLRLASQYDVLRRDALLKKADEITSTAIEQWSTFDQTVTARAMAILFVEAPRDVYILEQPAFAEQIKDDWPEQVVFVPQRSVVKALLKSAPGWLYLARAAVRPSTWRHLLRRRSQ